MLLKTDHVCVEMTIRTDRHRLFCPISVLSKYQAKMVWFGLWRGQSAQCKLLYSLRNPADLLRRPWIKLFQSLQDNDGRSLAEAAHGLRDAMEK